MYNFDNWSPEAMKALMNKWAQLRPIEQPELVYNRSTGHYELKNPSDAFVSEDVHQYDTLVG